MFYPPWLSVAFLLLGGGAPSTAHAQSAGTGGTSGGHHAMAPGANPRIDLTQPADSTDFTQEMSHDLNSEHDKYLALKADIQNDYNLQLSMPVSIFAQWGTPKGGPSVVEFVYSPSVTWTPFTNTAIGTGTFNFAFQANQFWTGANTNSQQARLRVITPPGDWGANGFQFAQLTYTHRLPGNWLSVSVGQYSFGEYDGNQYAGNTQTNFIGYALAQNATQTYANAGPGIYLQLNTPNGQVQFAGGLQGATNISGRSLNLSGLQGGSLAYFMSAQWTPKYLSGGSYGILWYIQPSVPQQPSTSQIQGVSFSAVQNLNATYGVFLRVNNASGVVIPIETSVTFGGIMNNPFGRNPLDQAGIGVAWNKTNKAFVGTPSRSSETVAELYYNYKVFKALQLTPDVQVNFNPALAPNRSVAGVFTIRTTMNF
jgi:hypothetical protein